MATCVLGGSSTFTWLIENFSFCTQKIGEYIESPKYCGLGSRIEWGLRLYPKGKEEDGFVVVYLIENPLDAAMKFQSEIDFEISLSSPNGTPIFSKEFPKTELSRRGGCVKVRIQHDNQQEKSRFLARDTLTVRCHLRMLTTSFTWFKKCSARTRIEVQREFFDWPIEHFSELRLDEQETSMVVPFAQRFNLQLNLYSNRPSADNEMIGVDVTDERPDKTKPIFTSCNISVLDSDLKFGEYRTIQEEHTFEGPENDTWSLSPFIPKTRLIDTRDQYLPDDCLTLFCEFAYSNGEHKSYIEENHEYSSLKCSNVIDIPNDVDIVPKELNTLSSDLQCLYSGHAFSDVDLKSRDRKVFPAHKAVLSARSPYFKAMFSSNFSENVTNAVEILKLDSDALDRMLVFIYSDELKDLNWEIAVNLYFAADYYQIPLLKSRCSTFLKSVLNVNNVCEMLCVAETSMDEEMKLAALDYIFAYPEEVFGSEEWSIFTKYNKQKADDIFMFVKIRRLSDPKQLTPQTD